MAPSPHARPEVLAFLSDCKEHPFSTAPRLILADWLEENGGQGDRSRVELLRVQCALARTSPHSAEEIGLKRQEQELLRRHGPAWIGDLQLPCLGWRISLGLLSVSVTPAQLTRLPPEVAHSESWAWVTGMTVYPNLQEPAPGWTCPPVLHHLTDLTLFDNRLQRSSLRSLTENPDARQLVRLTISYNNFGDEGARLLASSPYLRHLRTLAADSCNIGDEGARALVGAPALARLTYLSLMSNPISPATRALLNDSCPRGLQLSW